MNHSIYPVNYFLRGKEGVINSARLKIRCTFLNIINGNNTPIFLLLISYILIVICIAFYHVVWRDEVRALTICIESGSFFNIFKSIHNEGHPSLWYIILYFSYKVIPHYYVIKITSILIATIAVFIFLKTSPFKLHQKALFIFGPFPLYYYSIICRSYGLSMLLLFLFCTLYSDRFNKFILISIILFLLSQTNVHSLIIVIAITLSFLIEICYREIMKEGRYINRYNILLGLLLILSGIALAIIQIHPDASSMVFRGYPSANLLLKVMFSNIILPGSVISFGGQNSIIMIRLGAFIIWAGVIWLISIYLLRKPFIFIIFFVSIVGLGVFCELIYSFHKLHKGFFILLIIIAFWLDSLDGPAVRSYSPFLNWINDFVSKYKKSFISIFLLIQVLIAFNVVRKEVQIEDSSSMRLGKYINSNEVLKQAIIISEPDYFIEALPYYIKNHIYIPRENRFGKRTKFTGENKKEFSLDDLLIVAHQLKKEYDKPILLLLPANINLLTTRSIEIPYKRIFTFNMNSIKTLNNMATKLITFNKASSDENYDVYILN